MDELNHFKNDLQNSEELRRKLEEVCKRIAAERKVRNDGEVMVAAAKRLGYNISIASLEKAEAEVQELDIDELEQVAGGYSLEWCWADYMCIDIYNTPNQDEYEHNGRCITAWHCLTAFMHTDHGTENEVLCWSNYQCVKWNN